MRLIVKLILVFVCLLGISQMAFAQPNVGMKGRAYGKVFDAATNKPAEFVVVRVYAEDSLAIKKDNPNPISGALSNAKGEFIVEDLPAGKTLTVRFSMANLDAAYRVFTLRAAGGLIEKDLGNFKLNFATTLGTVVVNGGGSQIEFDKRTYDVEGNAMNTGGTAQDVLRNIPSLQVDTEGNVSLRNTSPQIFVDGRPTTLTIDQIPADAIQRVEIITNPSAKYDASGGGGGIINIIMKHNRSAGYNGSVKWGIDKRGRENGGLDFNYRQGKFNLFANGNFNQRRSVSIGSSDRTNLSPTYTLNQDQYSRNDGYMLNCKIGLDYLMDQRNTFTLSSNIMRGSFAPHDTMRVEADTLNGGIGGYSRYSDTKRVFQNAGGSILYKHLFAKEGTELNADVNLNKIFSDYTGNYLTSYFEGFQSQQKQVGHVDQWLGTSQIDFESRVNEKLRLETGTRVSMRDYTSLYTNYSLVGGSWISSQSLQVNYHYFDQVYAAYGTAAVDLPKWKYKGGLRAESSNYQAEFLTNQSQYSYKYPLSLFPSLFITRVINDKQDIQFAVNRKINRPSFMQLSPFTDYSDSLNIQRGNPNLRPEFTYTSELSWQYVPNKKTTFLVTLFGRYTTNITVRQQQVEVNPVTGGDVIINTYANANSSTAAGLEFVYKQLVNDKIDFNANLTLYNSSIDGTNISANLTNNISSYWAKGNINFKLPKSFAFQVMFDYTSKRALDVGSSDRAGSMGGGGMGGMGGGGYGGSTNTVQGYVLPTYGLDFGLRKEFLKNKSLIVSLSGQDVLRTRVNKIYSNTDYFTQETYKRRDWYMFRFNITWKFGKMDATLFKRKNMRSSQDSMEG